LVGCDILFSSNLPDGAGLSSSAALEVLSGFLMMKLAGEDSINRIELAKTCQLVENKFIGVNCGIMDQFSVAMGKKGHAILLDCNTLNYQHVPMDLKGYSLVIMNTNKKRELADSKYNERRAECDKALKIIKGNERITTLCQATMAHVDIYLKNQIVLKKRARHVISEQQRVMDSVNYLAAGKIKAFGQLMNDSHESLRNDYEVTGKELDILVGEAQSTSGCIGARMTGAGFGGCAIALVESDRVEYFQEKVRKEYHSKTNLMATFYESTLGDGVGSLGIHPVHI
ncbi:MAG: galactokinase, partial [Cytophagales bacterium]|nr:galactokinase [Cytophagales bacterium]